MPVSTSGPAKAQTGPRLVKARTGPRLVKARTGPRVVKIRTARIPRLLAGVVDRSQFTMGLNKLIATNL